MVAEIKRFGVIQTARIISIFYFVVSLFFCIPIGLYTMSSDKGGVIQGILILVAFPLLYAGFGFVSMIIVCLLYNVVAAKVGGITVELNHESVREVE